ncbi:HD domain-containing protein, partial [Rickettsia endosymbiont of Culicoides newsteadi]|uniref:HD domain-containing protein n=1 Tax=Rickettsia endosymbiont of Culicoides newsteadi TaxID=1961830 RepID=UPI001056569F
MEDINDWETKYEDCKYSERLLSKLMQINQEVTIPVDIDMVKKGIYYAKKYHGSQMRQSGDPYYSHPIEVAYMVAEYTAVERPKYYKTDMIITSLLHDTIEDTTLTEDMIGRIFGEQVASQVVDLTRVKSYGKISAAETMTLLCKQKKYNVAIIKIFDRIHNLQTLQAKSPEKIEKIVKESLKYFLIVVIRYWTEKSRQKNNNFVSHFCIFQAAIC